MSSQLHEAIHNYWGERCPDTEKGCAVCDAWAEYDLIVNALREALPFIGYEGAGADEAVKKAKKALAIFRAQTAIAQAKTERRNK